MFVSSGPLRYLSMRLLAHEPASWRSRVTLRARATLPGGAASLEGEVAPVVSDRRRAVERYIAAQRKQDRVLPVEQAASGGSAAFFEFDGPAAERFEHGVYWVALWSDATAILLVGSDSHVLGGPATRRTDAISPSVDPDGAAKAVLESQGREPDRWGYAYIWSAVMADALRTTPAQSLQRLRGVAENRGLP
jgi:hypothetical protein